MQAYRHRHRLLVVQQQRRQRGPDPEPVAARGARRGVHRVAQVAQPVDVAAQGPQADAEPAGQLGAGPVAPGLQQRQQAQQPGRCLEHVIKSVAHWCQKLTPLLPSLGYMTNSKLSAPRQATPADASIRPYRISVPQTEIDDLRDRLARPGGPPTCPAPAGNAACQPPTCVNWPPTGLTSTTGGRTRRPLTPTPSSP